MTQNAGRNQGGIDKSRDKSAGKERRPGPGPAGQTEARPLDPGTRKDGGAPPSITGGRR